MGVVWIFLFVLRAFAQPGVEVSSLKGIDQVAPYQVLEDPTGSWTIQDVRAKDLAGAFAEPHPPGHYPTYSQSAFWIKILFHNATDQELWYFEAQNRFWHQFETYTVSAAQAAPLHAASLPKPYPVTRIRLTPHASTVLYARMQTPATVALGFALTRDPYERDNTESLLALILAGALISLFIYNAFIFWALRERVQFCYLLFAAVNGYLAIALTCFPAIFPWRFIAAYRPLCPISTVIFTQAFFHTEVHYPRLHRLGWWLNGAFVVMILTSFFVPREVMLSIQDVVFLIFMAGIFAFAFNVGRSGYEPARLYMQGVGAFFLGVIGLFLANFHIIPLNSFTATFLLQGQTAEVFLMSLALASRMRRLKEEKMTADMVARHKGHLLRVISHDVATPLNVILFLAKQIRDTVPVCQRQTEKILRAAETIQNIRRFTMKVEHVSHPGALAPSLGSVLLAKVFEDLRLLFEDQAHLKNVTLTFSIPDETLRVKGDQLALTTAVFSNLLSNAIKFSHVGGVVTVSARVEGDFVTVAIEDKGIGTNRSFLLEGMVSNHGSTTEGTAGEKGSGFGLAIMEEYVHAFGGRVTVESRPEDQYPDHHGTTFKVQLVRLK